MQLTLLYTRLASPDILVSMKQQLQQATHYITEHKQQFGTGAIALIGVAVIVGLFIYNRPITYAAADACALLSPARAMDALGDQVIQTGNTKPVTQGDIATSRCGYTDKNEDPSKKELATIAVQSAITNDGIVKNKQVFDAHKEALGGDAKTVNNLGESAYYETTTGILNILSDKLWIKLLYGVGEGPTSKPLDDVTALARVILQ